MKPAKSTLNRKRLLFNKIIRSTSFTDKGYNKHICATTKWSDLTAENQTLATTAFGEASRNLNYAIGTACQQCNQRCCN